MDPRCAKLRLATLAASLALAILYIMSRMLEPFRNAGYATAAFCACAAYALLRAVNGSWRRELEKSWAMRAGTPLARSPWTARRDRAWAAWCLMDASWLALDLTTCLTWGVPGVMAALFQLLFVAGFRAAPDMRPDLYADQEHAQSADLLEALLYTQAMAALAVYAWLAG